MRRGPAPFNERIAGALKTVRAKQADPLPVIFRRPFLINAFHSVIPTDWNADILKNGTHPGDRLTPHEARLAQDSPDNGDVFFGIAGFKSLDMLCLIGRSTPKKYERVILCDINRRQVEAMRDVLTYIYKHEDPDEFIKDFAKHYPELMNPPAPEDPHGAKYASLPESERKQYYNAYGNSYTPPPTPAALRAWCQKERRETPYSWLKPANYEYIRALITNHRIAVARVDLRDQNLMGAIKKQLDKDKLHVGHCYVSSVLDFMDPYAKSDYYSGTETLEDIKHFYENILKLTESNPAAKFIVSQSSPPEVSPLLHNYHLVSLGRTNIEGKYKALPKKEPSADEKKYAILFNTGEQVWRLQEFEGPKREHYFRIFSETPPKDWGELRRQVGLINHMLDEIHGMPNRRRYAKAEFIAPKAIADLPEAKFFADQARKDESFSHAAEHGLNYDDLEDQDKPYMLSSKPFSLRIVHKGQDVHATIEALVKSIKESLTEKTHPLTRADERAIKQLAAAIRAHKADFELPDESQHSSASPVFERSTTDLGIVGPPDIVEPKIVPGRSGNHRDRVLKPESDKTRAL